MAEQQYRVIREHVGDKPYAEGDVRTADPKLVEHLVGRVLEPIEQAKSAPRSPKAPAKAAPKAPPPSAHRSATKAVRTRKRKG
jgi:hypothetical protein